MVQPPEDTVEDVLGQQRSRIGTLRGFKRVENGLKAIKICVQCASLIAGHLPFTCRGVSCLDGSLTALPGGPTVLYKRSRQ